MNRRLLAALAGSAVLVATVAPAPALAADPPPRVQRVDATGLDPSFRPRLADDRRELTVVLQLAAAPVLDVPGLSRAQRAERARALRAEQRGLEARVRAAGARVTGRYQYAYNGLRVRATGARLEALAALPGVVAVRPLRTHEIENTQAVPYVRAPRAWDAAGATGDGVTIAVIDTGIDYLHADFDGPGTPEAYDANDPEVIEAGSFPTVKVVAGHDFAGDDYDAGGESGPETPSPDPDPLDCNGHGTHVSGTAAGQGVLADHSTYDGPYDRSLFDDPGMFAVGPGVAPEASLVALKVFGCEGSTDLVVDALEWVAAYNVSHVDGIDVVNMSLGSPFGSNDDPDSVATNNLVDMGVVVVTSAGNESAVPYITGSPGAATRAISTAALDAFPAIPLATVDLPGPDDVDGNNQNAYPDLPVEGRLHVVVGDAAGLSLGCTEEDYDAGSAGAIVVVRRGVCPFVDKGAAAEAAGAIGIIVVNRTDTGPDELPTFIGYTPQLFRIPMIGVSRTAYDPLVAADGAVVTLRDNGSAPNPTYRQIVGFSSSGPRWADGWLKPDVAAPGVNMLSAMSGGGWEGTTNSGTSMASPVTAGTAALVLDVHPRWSPLRVKAAITNTADASADAIVDYDPLRAGAGVVRTDRAVATRVLATTGSGTASLSFGYEPLEGRYVETRWITLRNTTDRAVRYSLTASTGLVSITPSNVRIAAHDTERVQVRASLTRAQVAALPSVDAFVTGEFGALTSLSGVIVARPTRDVPGALWLRVPYLLVPRGLSDIRASLAEPLTVDGDLLEARLRLRNRGVHDGFGDTYALGRVDPRGDGANGTDVRAIGVQSLPGTVLGGADSDRALLFAVNMHDRFASPSPHEIDVAIDTDGDDEPDYFVVGIDNGLLFAGAYDGLFISVILDAETFDVVNAWLADAPLNGSTILLPTLASDLGLEEGSGSFRYLVGAFDGFTGVPDLTREAPFDAYDPGQSTGGFVEVRAGEAVRIPVWADRSAAGVRGWLVVSMDDATGASQADVVRIPRD